MADLLQFAGLFAQTDHLSGIERDHRRILHPFVEGAGLVYLIRQRRQLRVVRRVLIILRQRTHPLIQRDARLQKQLHLLAEQTDL